MSMTDSTPALNGQARLKRPSAELGYSGLRTSGGWILEETDRNLAGKLGLQTYHSMMRDPVVAAVIDGLWKFIEAAEYHVQPADEGEEGEADEETPAKLAAVFIEECLDDLSHTWEDFMSELSTMLPYGWAGFELVYKLRQGDKGESSPVPSSKYSDGRIGWRKFAPRPQDTLSRWEMDDNGGTQGLWQLPPTTTGRTLTETLIPIEKLILFKTVSRKGNPEGRSTLWSAYDPWYYRKRLREISAIGVERNVAGIPKIRIPSEIIEAGGSYLETWRAIGEGLRMDETAYVLMPSDVDPETKAPLYDVELLTTGTSGSGGAAAQAEEQISRYSLEIALSVLMDVIWLGHQKIGTQALAAEKRKLLDRSIQSIADGIASVFSRYAIPRLCRINGLPQEVWPTMKAGEIGEVDLGALADYVSKLAGAGMAWFPDEALANQFRRMGGLPEQADDFEERQEEDRMHRVEEMQARFRATANDAPDEDEETATDGPIADEA